MKKIKLVAGITVGTVMVFGGIQENCRKGEIEACYKLGVAYSQGNGVKKNIDFAKKYLELACNNGIKEACGKVKALIDNIDNTPGKQTSYIQKSSLPEIESGENLTHPIHKQYNSDSGYGKRFSTYSSVRFGFSLRYPSDLFTKKRLSDNGDGIILRSRDGQVELRAYGSLYGDNIRSNYKEEINWIKDSDGQVTYKVLRRTWYILSGYEAGGRTIFYQKTHYNNGISKSFKLTYPASKKRYYDKLVKIIGRGFRE